MFRFGGNILRFQREAVRSFGSQSGRHGTTILCVRKNGKVVCPSVFFVLLSVLSHAQVMAGDGQVTQGSVVIKPNVQKVRRIGSNILVGFAGSTADALTLLERLEEKLTKHPEQLTRACVELAKAWRTDRYLRKLEVLPASSRSST
jgi:ATP-dependent HslUV protease, peptidase subunit HslV